MTSDYSRFRLFCGSIWELEQNPDSGLEWRRWNRTYLYFTVGFRVTRLHAEGRDR